MILQLLIIVFDKRMQKFTEKLVSQEQAQGNLHFILRLIKAYFVVW